MLIPSGRAQFGGLVPSLSRRVNANSQLQLNAQCDRFKLIKKGEC